MAKSIDAADIRSPRPAAYVGDGEVRPRHTSGHALHASDQQIPIDRAAHADAHADRHADAQAVHAAHAATIAHATTVAHTAARASRASHAFDNAYTPPPRRSALDAPRPNQRLYVEMARTVDTTVAVLAVLTVFVLVNSTAMPLGLGDFLAERVRLKNVLLLGAFAFLWQRVFALFGLYDRHQHVAPHAEAATVVGACSVASLLTLPFPLVTTQHSFGLLSSVYVWAVSIAGTLVGRRALRVAVAARRPQVRRAIIVGSGPLARDVCREVQTRAGCRYDVMGFVDSFDRCPFDDIRERTLGRLEELERILMHTVVDEVLIALPVKSCYAEIQTVIEICERAGVESKYPADMFRRALARPHYDSAGVPMVALRVVEAGARLVVKRAVDIVGSAVGLVVLSPLLLAIAVAVRLSGPGPVLFVQERYGLRKRRFPMLKFRTMVCNSEQLQAQLESRNEASGPVFKIRRDPRVTRVGRLLRVSSLDELPQLFNVLRGDMSLVGPRPLPVRDVQRFAEPWLMRRFSVRPGLTCLWQVGGRSDTTFDEWMALDLAYIDQWSLWLDFKILLRTVPAVLRGSGAA